MRDKRLTPTRGLTSLRETNSYLDSATPINVLDLKYNFAQVTNNYLMSITEIQYAVMKLSADELQEFIEWIEELKNAQWDKQIAEDLTSGKLNPLIAEARKEKLVKNIATTQPRKFGCGKGIFTYVADDFDATPPGFEEYVQT